MSPIEEVRPWGKFRTFVKNEPVTVKIITITAKSRFSLQKHEKRAEFWKVLVGSPKITVGEQVVEAKVRDEFEIGVGELHRIEAGEENVEVLEISTGEFDEKDIVSLEDEYGRK